MIRALVILALAATTASADPLADLQQEFKTSWFKGGAAAKQTIALGERLLPMLAKAHGERGKPVIEHLVQLAATRMWAGDQRGATADLQRAARAALAAFPDDASLLENIARELTSAGALEEAELVRRRVLAIADKPGADAGMLVMPLDSLATLLQARDKLDEAIALRRRHVALVEGSQWYAAQLPAALIALGVAQALRRDLAGAEATLRKALAATDARWRVTPGLPTRADAAMTLAFVAGARGERDEARTLREQTLLVNEELGTAGAPTLIALAEDAIGRGELDDALALAERVRQLGGGSIRHSATDFQLYASMIIGAVAVARGDRDTAEVALREVLSHSSSPWVLQTLGALYLDIGERARGESLILAARELSKDAIAKRYQAALDVLRLSGQAAEANGKTDEAVRRYRETFEVSEAFLRSVRLGVQEDRLLAILDTLAREQDHVWSLTAAHPTHPGAVELGLTVALLRKGRGLDELAAAARAARDGDPQFQRLVALRRELARAAIAGRDAAKQRELVAEMTKLERTLRASGREPTELPAPSEIIAAVRAKLAANERLVEVVAYQPIAFAGGAGAPIPGQRYLAFILGAKTIAAVDLGASEAIDARVATLRAQVARGRDRPANDPELVAAQRALFDAVLRPLDLAGVSELALSLDGALQLVPFEIARDSTGELVERFAIRYATSGRDLLATKPAAVTEIRIVADPEFSTQPLRFGDVALAPPERLPYTRSEGDEIAKLFPRATVIAGDKATEDAILAGSSPRILHVATHGVFLDDAAPPVSGTRGVDVVTLDEPVAAAPLAPNPMLRSALLLAPDKEGDSIVTAYRLADANLDHTELVVLSACETGLGERKRNQGVFGLRRALLIAGARTVVTSLWRVSDRTTRDLMIAYYKKLLAGRGRAAALRDAALEIRKQQPHPYYWGGFVVVGSAAPLGR